jgi:hypothetical protein
MCEPLGNAVCHVVWEALSIAPSPETLQDGTCTAMINTVSTVHNRQLQLHLKRLKTSTSICTSAGYTLRRPSAARATLRLRAERVTESVRVRSEEDRASLSGRDLCLRDSQSLSEVRFRERYMGTTFK